MPRHASHSLPSRSTPGPSQTSQFRVWTGRCTTGPLRNGWSCTGVSEASARLPASVVLQVPPSLTTCMAAPDSRRAASKIEIPTI